MEGHAIQGPNKGQWDSSSQGDSTGAVNSVIMTENAHRLYEENAGGI